MNTPGRLDHKGREEGGDRGEGGGGGGGRGRGEAERSLWSSPRNQFHRDCARRRLRLWTSSVCFHIQSADMIGTATVWPAGAAGPRKKRRRGKTK